MPCCADPQPSKRRLHAIGLTANLVLLALYAVAGTHMDKAGAKPRLYWVLGGAALLAAGIAEVPAWLIAQLEEQSALLRKMAQTDALTQLLDRSTLGPRLSMHANGSAVVLIDLDNFKGYNDAHGHEAGDALLVAFADAIRWSVRKEDMAFRIGGDEFLLMLVDADRAHAEQVLDRLRDRWAEAGNPVGFSAGIASGERAD